MEPALKEKISQILSKYKYALLILLLGLGLMLLPERSAGKTEDPTPQQTVESEDLQQELEAILSQISGAGEVRVLLTQRAGEEVLYQEDSQSDSQEGSTRLQSDTVIVENADREESGLIRRTDPPVYRGAVVVCQGADSPQVRLAIVEAVRCVTGLGANEISVVKMK